MSRPSLWAARRSCELSVSPVSGAVAPLTAQRSVIYYHVSMTFMSLGTSETVNLVPSPVLHSKTTMNPTAVFYGRYYSTAAGCGSRSCSSCWCGSGGGALHAATAACCFLGREKISPRTCTLVCVGSLDLSLPCLVPSFRKELCCGGRPTVTLTAEAEARERPRVTNLTVLILST